MSRPQPLAAESGVRKKPSAERGPKASMAMRQPPSTITAGPRQSAAVAVRDRSAVGGLDIGNLFQTGSVQAGTIARRCTGFSTIGKLIRAESQPNRMESHQIAA